MQATTASQVAKRNGLKSLKEVSDITGQSSVTLINWYKNKRDLFEVVVISCVALKQIKGYQSGD